MPLWATLFSLILSLAIFAFNFVLLLAIATHQKLHTVSNVISCNLWMANCILSTVGIFYNLFYNNHPLTPIGGFGGGFMGSGYLAALGPQTLAALFNSTVSLLALLAMAFVQIFAHYQAWLPRSTSVRICACLWAVVVLIVVVNFLLMQLTQSFALIVAFQLALLSIFLVINLILHPVNLFMASRSRQEPQLAKSITQSLCLLLHSLSFTLLAMMLVWESSQRSVNTEENIQLLSLQLAAYSVHCIANPMIAVLREPRLARAIGRIVYGKESRSDVEYSAMLQQDPANWFLPEHWLLRHVPPPPPYVSPSISSESIGLTVEVLDDEGGVRHEFRRFDALQRPLMSSSYPATSSRGASTPAKACGVAPAPAHRSGSLSSI
ncbi:Protein F55D10.4 [Aphelenchoides avenae]|nr:Protein F55D10.4 [Aphelenchus avenae]